MNKVILMGRMTKDAELKYTQSGTAVCSFSLAVNRRYKDQAGNYPVDFINCQAWRQTAEFISKYFSKGRMIAVCGSIQTRTWDDQNGKRHYATEVLVEEAYFCGEKVENNTADNRNELPFADEFTPYDDAEDDLPF